MYQDSFRVTSIIDCTQQYDDLGRVEMASETGAKCTLDVNSNLYPQILRVGATMDMYICTELKVSEKIAIRASDPAFNPQISHDLKKQISQINYCMHGTAFEFQKEGDDKVKVFISFGGLLLVLTEDPSKLVKFKSGQ